MELMKEKNQGIMKEKNQGFTKEKIQGSFKEKNQGSRFTILNDLTDMEIEEFHPAGRTEGDASFEGSGPKTI